MKKFVIVIILLSLCLLLPSSNLESKFNTNEYELLTNESSNYSIDKYQEITLYLINPYIQEEIDKYYSKYLTISPLVYTYYPYTNVVNVEKLHSGEYQIKLRINSVTGPHIQVGTDDITLKIGTGRVETIKFEHIKSFELPERYVKYIKEGYSNPIP